MGNAVDKRKKEEQTLAMVFGICAIVVLTLVVYIIGYLITQSSSFAPGTNYGSIVKRNLPRYFMAMLSMIAPILIYIWQFLQKAGRSLTEWSGIKIKADNAPPYIYKGWTLWAIISGVLSWVLAFFIHYFAFQQHADLIKPIMALVFTLQTIVSVVVFFIPPFKPLKRG